MILAALFQFAEDGSGLGNIGPFINLGAIGVLCVVLIGFARGAYQREVKRADACEEAIRDLYAKIADSWVPALTRSTEALAEVTEALRRDRERDRDRERR